MAESNDTPSSATMESTNFKGAEFDADVWKWLADYCPDEEQA